MSVNVLVNTAKGLDSNLGWPSPYNTVTFWRCEQGVALEASVLGQFYPFKYSIQ